MVVVMQERASDAQVQRVIAKLIGDGLRRPPVDRGAAHRARRRRRHRGSSTPRCSRCSTACRRSIASPSPTSSPAARSSRRTRSSRVGDVRIGGDEVIVMAGPCSAESEEQVEASGRGGQARRREGAARRRVQAAQQPLQLPGPRRRRAAAAAGGGRSPQPEADHRGDGHQPARADRALRRHPPGRRAQHAELHAAARARATRRRR